VEIPFMVLPVFATNIRPAELVDEAFLRRIHFKVFAENPTADDFKLIFANCCHERGLEYDPRLADHVVSDLIMGRGIALRGCQPRDLIEQALAIANYLEQPPALTPDLLERACATYFVDEDQGVARA
jgi:hypothetical protein